MRILIFEFITGGGMSREPLPEDLACEGELMLQALVRDLRALSVHRLVIFRDRRLKDPPAAEGDQVVHVSAAESFRQLWHRWIGCCDAVWPVAPETGGVLEQVCRDVERAGKRLLNSSSSAVAIAGSKRRTGEVLQAHGVTVVPSFPWGGSLPSGPGPWVIKPDDGVGCEGIRLVADLSRLPVAGEESADRSWLLQPFVDGDPLSLSAVFGHGGSVLLSCNRQEIALEDGRIKLKGCWVGAVRKNTACFSDLLSDIGHALPGLRGYVGVDLINTTGGPQVVEINPRLTSSYAGLGRALRANPARLVLDAFVGEPACPAPEPCETREIYVGLEH